MISSKKKFFKRIWSGIIISIFLVIIASFLVTKVVYDGIFERYDIIPSVPSALSELVENRESIKFKSGENELSGYIYNADSDGLIVFIPGYHASVDEYLWQIDSLNKKGWAVFCFDPTGSCLSEGNSAVGFSQVIYDLKAALDFAEQNDRFGYEDIYLLGHSRGAYAACGVLSFNYDIKAVVAVSAVNSSMEAVIQPAESTVGVLAYANYPFLYMYQDSLFGSKVSNLNAARLISESNVPVMIVQGSADEKYSLEKYSLYSHSLKSQRDNVEYLLCDKVGQNGHTNLLFDKRGQANDFLIDEIDRFLRTET